MSVFYTPGRYRIRITGNKITTSKKKRTPQLEIRFLPIGYYDPDLTEQAFPYERSVYLAMTEATMGTPEAPGWVLETMYYLGFQGCKTLDQLNPDHADPISFAGVELDATSSAEEYEGKDQERWTLSRGAATEKADVNTMADLDKRFAHALITKPRPSQTNPAPSPTQDKDIPF
jgi:hypothetical protein